MRNTQMSVVGLRHIQDRTVPQDLLTHLKHSFDSVLAHKPATMCHKSPDIWVLMGPNLTDRTDRNQTGPPQPVLELSHRSVRGLQTLLAMAVTTPIRLLC